MRIRNFSSTLGFATTNLREEKGYDSKGFENNFDEIIERAVQYIRTITAGKQSDGTALSQEELNTIILEDYDRVVNETYQNTDIPIISMKYIALKYLTKHKDQIPELLKEIEERGIKYSEDERYTDDFHENLINALISVKNDYDIYYQNMRETNPEQLAEIEGYVSKFGKEEGFKKYCDRYSNMKMLPFMVRRQIMTYAYFTIFGIEGLDESKLPKKSGAAKYKNSIFIRDYIGTYLDRLEPMYRENLEGSILSRFEQLERFGEITYNLEKHNEKMKRIGLPGLGYCIDDSENAMYPNLPRVSELMNKSVLSQLDIDVLLRMNSFYNNRLAKVINDYSMALFVMDSTNTLKSYVENGYQKSERIPGDVLEQLMIKYQTLILPIKAFYTETQREIEQNPDDFYENIYEVNTGDDESKSKKQVVLNVDDFADQVSAVWKDEYQKHFDTVLPDSENNLRQDILMTNMLYNPVFLSYRFKNMALKSEYAHLHYMSQEEPEKSLNFGIVLKGRSEEYDGKRILVASDGGLNLANRLHTFGVPFIDFLKAYTGSARVKIYEGFDDFKVGGEYISSQVLLPNAKQHKKYLKDLMSGKLADSGDKVSRITPLNKRFVEHYMYCMDNSQFMKSHKFQVRRKDANGISKIESKQLNRYLDLEEGIKYIKTEDGRYIEEVMKPRQHDENELEM